MERFQRFISLIILAAFSIAQLPAIDWQGAAAPAASSDFPTGGYYGASSAFPLNSLVDIKNPANGKTVRVIIVRTLNSGNLLVSISPEAATALGMQGSNSVAVKASQVPLPSGFGAGYGNEPALRTDPDYFVPDPIAFAEVQAQEEAKAQAEAKAAAEAKALADAKLAAEAKAAADAKLAAEAKAKADEEVRLAAEKLAADTKALADAKAAADAKLAAEAKAAADAKLAAEAKAAADAKLADEAKAKADEEARLAAAAKAAADAKAFADAKAAADAQALADAKAKAEEEALLAAAAKAAADAKALAEAKAAADAIKAADAKIAEAGNTELPNLNPTKPENASDLALNDSPKVDLTKIGPDVGPATLEPNNKTANIATLEPGLKDSEKTTVLPKTWVGIKSGLEDLGSKTGNASDIGSLKETPKVDTSKTLAQAPAKNSGFASGLETYQKKVPSFNPGDVARPQTSLWLENATTKKVAALPDPKKPAAKPAELVGPPEAFPGLAGKSATRVASSDLNGPGLPKLANTKPETFDPDQALLYRVGGGSYAAELDRLQARPGLDLFAPLAPDAADAGIMRKPDSRIADAAALPLASLPAYKADTIDAGIARPGSVQASIAAALAEAGLAGRDTPESGALVPWPIQARGLASAGALPEAVLAGEEKPVAGSLAAVKPGQNTASAGTLPDAVLAGEEKPVAGSLVAAKPGQNAVSAGTLPNAILAGEEKPAKDGLASTLPGDGKALNATLAEANLAGEEAAEASLPVSLGSLALLTTELPLAKTRPEEVPDSLVRAKNDTPIVQAELAESVLKGEEKPESPVPRGFSDNVILSFEPADYRPPRLPADAESAPGTPRPASGSKLALDGSEPGLPAKDVPQAGDTNLPPKAGEQVADLSKPNIPGKDIPQTADSALPPKAGEQVADLSKPNIPGKDIPQTADSALPPKTGEQVADLAKPGNPEGAQAGNVVNKPDAGSAIASIKDSPTLPDGGKPQSTTQIKPNVDTNVVALDKPKDTKADAGTESPVVDAKVKEILAFLDPAKAKPPVDSGKDTTVKDTTVKDSTVKDTTVKVPQVKPETTKVELGAAWLDRDWALANLPLGQSLQAASWYVQVGSFAQPRSASLAVQTVAPGYPVVVIPEASGAKGLYKVFVGPLREDEKGLILYWFRSKGYKDAFARQGAPR